MILENNGIITDNNYYEDKEYNSKYGEAGSAGSKSNLITLCKIVKKARLCL